MFHLKSTTFGVDTSASSQAEFASMAQGCVAKGILTVQDVKAVQSGSEVWVFGDGRKKIVPDRRL